MTTNLNTSTERDPRSLPYPEPTEDEPDFETLKHWIFDGVSDATDGCQVEPDGMCPHGHPSWLLALGLI